MTRTFGLAGSGIRAGSVTARLVRYYNNAPAAMASAGRAWYDVAGSIAADIAESTDTRIDTVAGVIAALSPQTRWTTNVAAAQSLCEGNRNRYPSMLGSNHQRALNVLSVDNPVHGLGDGPKVHAFFENILGDTDKVTIDSWAVRAAVSPAMLARTGVSLDGLLKRKNVYSDLANCYRAAALITGEQPSTLQAIVWCAIRGRAD